MSASELRDEIFRLADELARGQWSETKNERLTELLQGSAEARRIWFQFQDLELGLAEWAAVEEAQPVGAPREAALDRRRGWSLRHLLTTAIATALLLAGMWWVGQRERVQQPTAPSATLEYVATLSGQEDCLWQNTAALTTGCRLAAGRFKLLRGQAFLSFDAGARMVVMAPAEFVLESQGAARVIDGKVAVQAPEEAVGFRLTTAQGTAIDLGTEFVIAVDRRGVTECQVLEGQVEWRSPLPSQKSALLSQGEARRFVEDRSEAITAPPLRFADFVPRPAAGEVGELLAYEPFDYSSADLPVEQLAGGFGWRSPWRGRFVPTDIEDLDARIELEPGASLSCEGLAPPQGGSLTFGSERLYRLRELPAAVDFGRDGVHYFSFLLRPGVPLPAEGRQRGPMRLELRSAADYWTQVVGVSLGTVTPPLILAAGNNSAGGSALTSEQTVLAIWKIVTAQRGADQMFLKVYADGEPVEGNETTRWTVVSRDLDFQIAPDHLVLAIPRTTGGRFDELRVGTSWQAVVPLEKSGP